MACMDWCLVSVRALVNLLNHETPKLLVRGGFAIKFMTDTISHIVGKLHLQLTR